MQAAPKAIAATKSINVAPLEEKVAAVEKKVQESQYALKFVGAAFSSMQESFPRLQTHIDDILPDMASSAFCNPTDM